MRRAALLLAMVATAVLVTGGAALAKNISCARQDARVCVGTKKMDTITGTNKTETIKARGGDDAVAARGGNDKVFGQDGDDSLDGGTGNDTLDGGPNPGNEYEFVAGGPGDDTLVESPGLDKYGFQPGWGQDRITGNGDQLPLRDTDALCFACGINAVTTPLNINLTAGTATDGTNNVTWDAAAETFIEDVTGGSAGDHIVGSARANIVHGFGGADTINVSGDPTTATDSVNCGDGDGVTDTVTRDPRDTITPSCASDTIITVP